MAAGAVLILCAAALLVFNRWQDQKAGENAEKILAEMKEQMPDESPEINPLSDDMDFILIDGEEYIGILDIPAIGIELPVHGEWSLENARTAPCRYTGSVYDDSLIIAGHNYSSHFGNLRNLSAGDEVYFTDVNGRRYTYKVTGLEQLGGYDTEKMKNGTGDLTLFTCTPGGRQRVTVRCGRYNE